jgi:HD-like signal output (HDOD) protein
MMSSSDTVEGMRKIDLILNQADQVGVYPGVAAKIQEIAKDPWSDLKKMEKTVALDPTLSARVLKIANSAFYGLQREVSTLSHALGILGFVPTRDLALALSLGAMGEQVGVRGDEMWTHSLRTAATCKLLARFTRGVRADDFFVIGMLHDVGILLLLNLEKEKYERIIRRFDPNNPALLQAERLLFGFDHAALGAQCLRRWGLPEHTCDLVQVHHHIQRPGDKAHALLKLAEFMEEEALHDKESAIRNSFSHPANQVLRLPESILARVVEVLEEEIRELQRVT